MPLTENFSFSRAFYLIPAQFNQVIQIDGPMVYADSNILILNCGIFYEFRNYIHRHGPRIEDFEKVLNYYFGIIYNFYNYTYICNYPYAELFYFFFWSSSAMTPKQSGRQLVQIMTNRAEQLLLAQHRLPRTLP